MWATSSNNGMHPTANSAALIVNLCGFEVGCAAGDAGRWSASHKMKTKTKTKAEEGVAIRRRAAVSFQVRGSVEGVRRASWFRRR